MFESPVSKLCQAHDGFADLHDYRGTGTEQVAVLWEITHT